MHGTFSSFFGTGEHVRENRYQSHLIAKLRDRFPGCFILKNDTDYMQGVPDLLVLYENKWAMLEVKASEDSPYQPNQNHYINIFDAMSFGAFIYPENESEVLHDLSKTFKPRR